MCCCVFYPVTTTVKNKRSAGYYGLTHCPHTASLLGAKCSILAVQTPLRKTDMFVAQLQYVLIYLINRSILGVFKYARIQKIHSPIILSDEFG